MTTKNTRRDFTDEFKREAVSLLRGSGRPLTQVAGEAGPAAPATRPGAAAGAASAERVEIRRLQKELERAQMERDILKKAVGIFSGPPR